MRRLIGRGYMIAGAVLALLTCPACEARGRAASGAGPGASPEGGEARFRIIYSQDFTDVPAGPYQYARWVTDFNHPIRICPDEPHWSTGAKLDILEERGNRFLRHRVERGDFGISGELGMDWLTPIGRHEEVYLSYRARASEMFGKEDLNGKLPGIEGDHAPGSGAWAAGRRPGPDQGFCATLMFGSPGAGGPRRGRFGIHPFVYHQEMESNDRAADGTPRYWGNSFGARRDLETNRWYTITQRVVLNDPGRSNGLVEWFVDGTLWTARAGFRFRETEAVTVDFIATNNFLGGSGEHPVADGYWDFDDFVVFVYRDGVSVPRGKTLSPADRVLDLPRPARAGGAG